MIALNMVLGIVVFFWARVIYWRQDFKGLKKWMNELGVTSNQLAYFASAEPQYYGVWYTSRLGKLSMLLAKPTISENLPVSTYFLRSVQRTSLEFT